MRPSLICALAATFVGPVVANSVTSPLAGLTSLARAVAKTATLATSLAPPSSPELSVPTATEKSSTVEDHEAGPPEITAISNGIASELNEKFVQTTYYSCVTMGTYSHCGWHIPILDARAAPVRGEAMVALRAGAAVAAIFALMMMW